MSAEGPSQRIRRTDHPAERDLGRRLALQNVLCLAILFFVVGWGWLGLRQHIVMRKELIQEFRQGVHGLRDEMEQIDQKSSDLIVSTRDLIHRREEEHRRDILHHRANAAARLEQLERQLRGERERMREAQAACLAEFDFYRRRRLAVPMEALTPAIERLIARQADEISALADDVHTHLELERTRLAELDAEGTLGWDRSATTSPFPTIASGDRMSTEHSPASGGGGESEQSSITADRETAAEGSSTPPANNRELVVGPGAAVGPGSSSGRPGPNGVPKSGVEGLIRNSETRLPPPASVPRQAATPALAERTGLGFRTFASGRRVEMGNAAPPRTATSPVVILPPSPKEAPAGAEAARQ
jgi:hypothetical protein